LQSVYGKAEPGDMLALMGPSGAGKSTLMDILAGRKSVGNLTGSVLVNGMPRKKDDFARKTAYVPQVRDVYVYYGLFVMRAFQLRFCLCVRCGRFLYQSPVHCHQHSSKQLLPDCYTHSKADPQHMLHPNVTTYSARRMTTSCPP
jgi:ABC-type Mn2+/Zn2+ transport system ATPase subunit